MIDIIIALAVSLVWSSFINALAHRLLRNKSLLERRSRCPNCEHVLAWYDLVPVLSQLFLGNKCRYCKNHISYLYPFVELAGCVIFTLLWLEQKHFLLDILTVTPVQEIFIFPYWSNFICSIIYVSLLLMALRTDLEEMVILRLSSLYPIPLWFAASYLGFIPTPFIYSLIGCAIGYGLPWLINRAYYHARGVIGIGAGDLELLAMIGAFSGPLSLLKSLSWASVLGLAGTLVYLFATSQNKETRIPFAPYLALGAVIELLLG